MDIEDWYHLDYFQNYKTDKTISMLDGLENYIEILNRHNVKTTFFVLDELKKIAKEQILYADKCGHEIACHGLHHTKPLLMDPSLFEKEIKKAKYNLSNLIGKEIVGYRAPCYSIDDERYKIIQDIGFRYSSSRINIHGHPLYGKIDLSGFEQPMDGIYRKDNFYEFSLSTSKFLHKNVAISGGGWIRIFPWNVFMKPLIKDYLDNSEVYTLYIHPFELSNRNMPKVSGSPLFTNIRARRGLGKVEERMEQIIDMLEHNNFEIKTFSEVIENIKNNTKGDQ